VAEVKVEARGVARAAADRAAGREVPGVGAVRQGARGVI
jgi:hypothetical protein